MAGMIAVIVVFRSESLVVSLKNTDLCWALLGLVCYWINYLFRSMRFCTISENSLKLWPDAIRATCLHGLATYMLPFRAGDFALPAILKSINGTSWIEGGRMLIKSRILDVVSLGFLMVCAAVWTSVRIPYPIKLGWIGIGTALMISPMVISRLIASGKKIFSSTVQHWIVQFQNVSAISLRELMQSIMIWIAIGGCLFCAARAVGLTLGLGDAVFLISIQFPLQLIPVQGFANAGNHEGGWVAALAILGVPASSALVFALASHALVFLYVVSLGGVSLLMMKR